MSNTGNIDYDALAKQYGATSSQAIDYDALAKKHGAISSTASHGKVPQEQLDRIQALNENPTQFEQKGGKTGNERFADPIAENGVVSRGTNFVRGAVNAVTTPFLHPIETIEGMGKGIVAGGSTPYGTPITAPTGNQEIDAQNELTHRNAQQETMDAGARELKDHPGYVAGQFAGPVILGKAIQSPAVRAGVSNLVPESVSTLASKVVPSVKGIPEKVQSVVEGPQSKVMESASNLPRIAQSGVEDIFRASAPTSMNKGFRENLNVAAPDLADIARKIDISEAKGGIINPDMRVRATVGAIRDHLQEMYQTERAPQIQAHANEPVNVGTNADAIRGLEFLESTAGQEQIRGLATKAIEGKQLTLAEADALAQAANKNLKTFEKMTPEGKVQASITSPKIGGLKSLDQELGRNMNDVLTANGEQGLRDYERRFAALSVVRDQLESRMNATELKQEGVFGAAGRITRPIGKLIKEGPSGVPSASQAATADVNIGRSLQVGMKKLKASQITARPVSPVVPPEQ